MVHLGLEPIGILLKAGGISLVIPEFALLM
jgi:hypothetical protein